MRLLPIASLMLIVSCREASTFRSLNIEGVRSDGVTVTAIVVREDITASQAFYEHGSRYERVIRRTGAIQWMLPGMPAAGAHLRPTRILRLADERAEAGDARGARLPPVSYEPVVFGDRILYIDYDGGLAHLRPLEASAAGDGPSVAVQAPTDQSDNLVFSRSGRHFAAPRSATLVVVDSKGPSVARELHDSPGLRDMRWRLGDEDFLRRLLTDDGRYWIEVPHNAGKGPGSNHCKAVFLDLNRDTAGEVTFAFGGGNHEVLDAGSVNGQLVFLVSYDGKLAVADSQGTVSAWLPDERAGYKPGTPHYWDAARKRLVSWRMDDLSSWGPLIVADHDYASGVTTTSYAFDLGDALTVLEGR